MERLRLLYKLWRGPDAEFIPVTPDELRRLMDESVVVRDAQRYWIRLL